jgi:transposase
VPASPYDICLDDAGRAELEAVSRRATAPFRLVLRARIVLLAAGGAANSSVAARLGICEDTARKWRRRYCEQGLAGLADAPRPGRPRTFPARVVAEIKALACELPAGSGKPLARWTCPELARQAVAGGITPAVSASTVRRWLADDAIKPWQHRSWIFPRDPHFAGKGGRVLDLYQREWEGRPLGPDEYVLSADEKPGVHARMRIRLPLPAEAEEPDRPAGTASRRINPLGLAWGSASESRLAERPLVTPFMRVGAGCEDVLLIGCRVRIPVRQGGATATETRYARPNG